MSDGCRPNPGKGGRPRTPGLSHPISSQVFSRENLGGDVGKVKVIAWQNHIWDRRESDDLETLIQSLNPNPHPEVIISNQQSHLEQVHDGVKVLA